MWWITRGPRYKQAPSFSASTQEFASQGYICPRCKSLLTELPVDCPVCGLPNVTSSALARSFHHLFPVQPFERDGGASGCNCAGCGKWIRSGEPCLRSQKTREPFCADCDTVLHDAIHNELAVRDDDGDNSPGFEVSAEAI